ncbi:hypothetical protein [Natronorubrum halalkaliphilum]|nr:hypothetical protein [Natronorubrum halalkaliphilum]
MIGFLRTIRLRERGQPLVPVALAVIVAILGALGYLELVSLLVGYVG